MCVVSVAQLWVRHSARAIRSPHGYVVERTEFKGESPDTVFICWSPGGVMIGGVSGDGIDGARAKALCDRHAGLIPKEGAMEE